MPQIIIDVDKDRLDEFINALFSAAARMDNGDHRDDSKVADTLRDLAYLL